MPSIQESKLGVWYGWDDNQGGFADQVDSNFLKLATLTQLNVLDAGVTVAPGSPADGATYLIGASATGAWAGKDQNVAVWRADLTAWEFYVPKIGWVAGVSTGTYAGQIYTCTSAGWVPLFEQGPWVPSAYGSSTPGDATYSIQIGSFQRRGNRVRAECSVAWSGHTGSGDLRIGPLPYVSKNVAGQYSNITMYHKFVYTAGQIPQGFVAPGTDYMQFDFAQTSGVAASIPIPAAINTCIFTVEYEI